MSAGSYQRGAWTVTTNHAPDQTRHLHHGNNTLLDRLPGVIEVPGAVNRYHGAACSTCKHYPCAKTPRADQGHCEWPGNRFERRSP